MKHRDLTNLVLMLFGMTIILLSIATVRYAKEKQEYIQSIKLIESYKKHDSLKDEVIEQLHHMGRQKDSIIDLQNHIIDSYHEAIQNVTTQVNQATELMKLNK